MRRIALFAVSRPGQPAVDRGNDAGRSDGPDRPRVGLWAFVASVVYLLVTSAEMSVVRRLEKARGVDV